LVQARKHCGLYGRAGAGHAGSCLREAALGCLPHRTGADTLPGSGARTWALRLSCRVLVGAAEKALCDRVSSLVRMVRSPCPSTPAAKHAARTKKRLEAQRAALFTARYLFVQRHLSKTERKTLWRVSRGFPQLHALRAVMDQVYALFDRRCQTQTALAKLAKLRRRLQRFPQVGETLKKLFAPTLDKALTFLDDKLLPSTSNAVERSNRRYRKMQKSVYRVRTQAQIRARLVLDMWREAYAEGRQQTLAALHRARAG